MIFAANAALIRTLGGPVSPLWTCRHVEAETRKKEDCAELYDGHRGWKARADSHCIFQFAMADSGRRVSP